ncbi:hypothetical protein KUH03_37815 [Sphingobacterium sp. E70]|uniref:hypothetical protein n=1 Tax=Sphingobacterium sp. E70 TaxID=2853439 RepID=UPI00211C85CA|nr:hypothetical protein [Sphingobacterium sp. E70]ULT24633.1 hypothetical protein KUH03_37815 [Sphingobacterium sp. E70]
MKLYRTGAFYCLIVILLLVQLFSCHQNKPQDAQKATVVANDSLDLSYENVMLRYLSTQDFKSAALVNKKRNELLKDGYFEHSPYSSILLAYEYLLDDNIDSVEIALKNLEGQKLSSDLAVLKDYLGIRANFSFHDVTSGTMMEQIIDAKEYALAHESVFTFLFYNLLANAEYRQGEYRQALKDVESWYHYHPNKSNAHVSQAYQEMKFMQYMALHDFEKLKGTLDSCKHYANATKDSAIIMRMYDLQSQYYFSIENNSKALEASKSTSIIYRQPIP